LLVLVVLNLILSSIYCEGERKRCLMFGCSF
jgi:hypothetical protein